MAGGSLLLLLDDIASVMDDVAAMSKLAARKTAGVLGDDLALNAQQVVGVKPERELPIVWAVAKGSLVNKLILVPAALLISFFAPWVVTPLLMVGGAYLCYEGFEKVYHLVTATTDDQAQARQERLAALADPNVDMQTFERNKIKGAVRTDFILSAEIIAITLGVVANAPIFEQFVVLAAISLAITIGVYGLVGAIVKIDDVGLYLSQKQGVQAALGRGLLWFAPYLMKILSIVGTAAMFMVGGGIFVHGISRLSAAIESFSHQFGSVFAMLLNLLLPALVGMVVGAVVFAVMHLIGRLRGSTQGTH